MKQRELRITSYGELRASADGKSISGYAAVFDSPSSDLGGFTEVIKPGAFARCIRDRQDVRCLFNHSPNHVLGRTASGTLELHEDSQGLFFKCSLPKTALASDLRESIARGDVSGCSFGFSVHEDNWPSGDRRELLDIGTLYDVGPVTFPAYEGTNVAARSLGVHGRSNIRLGYYRSDFRGCFARHGDVTVEELERLRMRLMLALRQ